MFRRLDWHIRRAGTLEIFTQHTTQAKVMQWLVGMCISEWFFRWMNNFETKTGLREFEHCHIYKADFMIGTHKHVTKYDALNVVIGEVSTNVANKNDAIDNKALSLLNMNRARLSDSRTIRYTGLLESTLDPRYKVSKDETNAAAKQRLIQLDNYMGGKLHKCITPIMNARSNDELAAYATELFKDYEGLSNDERLASQQLIILTVARKLMKQINAERKKLRSKKQSSK